MLHRFSILSLLITALAGLTVFLTLNAPPAVAQQTVTVWSATLTVTSVGTDGGRGCNQNCPSQLTRDSFAYQGLSYRIIFIKDFSYGGLNITMRRDGQRVDTTPLRDLILTIDGAEYPVAEMTTSPRNGAVLAPSTLLNLAWEPGDKVALRFIKRLPGRGGDPPGGENGGGGGSGGGGGGGGPSSDQPPRFDEEPPVSRSVPENSPAGTPVGDPVVAEDPEGNQVKYRLIHSEGSQHDWRLFTVDEDTGQVMVKEGTALDYEGERNVYEARVVARDVAGSGKTSGIDVTINVTDVKLPGKADDYDVANNHNEMLEFDEAMAAVFDYFDFVLTQEEILAILLLYLEG